MCKVSVIMPCLNVAEYMEKCLNSVVCQTLKDIEILVIDAGSTDGTAEIIRSYMEKDSRIRFIHSDRKSYGHQVNLGLSAAQGEYVGIVETDDWIEPDAYEILYQYAGQYKPDYIRGTAECCKETAEGLSYTYPLNIFPEKAYDDNQGVIQINPQQQRDLLIRDIFLWNGIYKRDFLQGIKLNETAGAAYQDVGFLSQMYYKAVKAVYIDKLVYHYRKDNEGCSSYSRNAFRYLVEEYQFIHASIKPDDEIWKLWNDARYFHQIYKRFQFMAETGAYWNEAETYIEKMYAYFQDRQDVIPFLGEVQREGFALFVESPARLYDFLRENYIGTENIWNKFLQKFENRKIVIFGSGKRGHFLQFLLTKRNIGYLLGYCDNDPDKVGKDIAGLAVRPLDDWIEGADDICYVVAAKAASDEIVRQLLESGILRENIMIFDLPCDFSVL